VASQTAKQVIIQRLREAERMSMFEEYKSKEGEIINGSVHRVEGRNIYIDLGKSIGVLYPSEQIPGEYYRIGQRLRVYIKKVEEDSRGSGITLSRASVGLVEKLFELEVPEIFTKTIEIKASAREAGNRTKIAVVSNDSDIDPIGSCVGQKGTRVQAIIEELGGERIDIIEWSEKPEKMIASALSPAKVIKVELNEEEGTATAYVEGDQLSLAIGQKGQNVRLAAKLTGWKIDVAEIEDKSKKKEEKPATTEAEVSKEEKAEESKKEKTEEPKKKEKAKKDSAEDKDDKKDVKEDDKKFATANKKTEKTEKKPSATKTKADKEDKKKDEAEDKKDKASKK
jgi:N utilization substance protein A